MQRENNASWLISYCDILQ